MLIPRLRLLVAALWAGSLWAVGYLVAPTLSATLADRKLFGTIVGSIFNSQAWLSVGCAAAMLVLVFMAKAVDGKRRRTLYWLVLAMLACTVLGYFGIQPMLATLRAAAGPQEVMASEQRTLFGILHGVSAVFYLVQSVLGAVLVVKAAEANFK
ncbi:DUF4149 domain-containing protein [Massilia cavernae]|uniref:DUF4149 domain-containing protein n=1 Tax=Massilia cavernae TaxID=2320864 RepID=A0A418XAS0_9BURK|nr:DUF4149 domain-containing protein [Massilia cavernae]RJG09468.1 DUF4149 domain-containing protein [Massilia cavernae]